MYQLPEARKIIESTLENYKHEFHDLVKRYADYCINKNQKYCDFFVDIATLMNGGWGISSEHYTDCLPEFREFDWYEILLIDEERDPESLYIPLLNQSYKIGYLWIERQLAILKIEIQCIEIRLYHNGSGEYQKLV